ncbi:MAG TPA: low affinity iron permease family protein [Flavipsychrobacter sp.]|nr:low affinity iron permease family protein [Flavipsychrobacter sp.]
MSNSNKPKQKSFFDRFSTLVTKVTGKPVTFIVALSVIIIWAISGPIFNYSDTWQLIINTGTTIITFLMVFVIQQSQNKDTEAMQLKLNELIAATLSASNRLIDIEDLSEKELDKLKEFYVTLSNKSREEKDFFQTHSIDEAEANHRAKQDRQKDQK